MKIKKQYMIAGIGVLVASSVLVGVLTANAAPNQQPADLNFGGNKGASSSYTPPDTTLELEKGQGKGSKGAAGQQGAVEALQEVQQSQPAPSQPSSPAPSPGPSPEPEPEPEPEPQYFSFGSLPGWEQEYTPIDPADLDWTAWTHLLHFGMYPSSDSQVEIGDMVSTQNAMDGVTAAHNAGKKAILVIGGEGEGADFVSSSSTEAGRTLLAENMVATMVQYGYDGLSIDWEEDIMGNEDEYVDLVHKTRAELNQEAPNAYLGVDVISGLNPPSVVAEFIDVIDTINIMSYWSDGMDEYDVYSQAGIPAEKMILGIGASDTYEDDTQAKVQAKVDLVESLGLKGTELWQIGDLNTYKNDPRLIPLRTLVSDN